MADDDLPDSLEPAVDIPPRDEPPAPPTPKGDLRIASVVAIVTGVIVIAWYLFVATASAIADVDNLMWIQIGMWVLAVISFVCGIVSLNARMARELAAAGFIAGVAAGLLSVTIGLFSGLELLG
ncbi:MULTISPECIES: hypothetical protein [Microbacterium]|uniref:Uncharacterized protein n=1 Tax=Microbacterium testaceum TaxID=2033 RepID=A0A4Y3QLT8_MICTE|nr:MULTISPECIES: hypothetical protein [Microbacterium]MDZ5144861.1 hypothetical protein [Microbacterium testaceum]REC97912.1 hypothetical protein DEU35_2407 [Microbacterium sp. AG157]WJS91072.1 hypothetical protein NYQ11_00545 [Microbacterium testaceum]GEB45837.1 hypothetical protein MTE01_17820 [Microbacterium testaceum]